MQSREERQGKARTHRPNINTLLQKLEEKDEYHAKKGGVAQDGQMCAHPRGLGREGACSVQQKSLAEWHLRVLHHWFLLSGDELLGFGKLGL